MRLGLENAFDDKVTIGPGLGDVALDQLDLGQHVTRMIRVKNLVVASVIRVKDHRALGHRVVGCKNGRQRLVLDVNQQECGVSGFAIYGGDGGDRFTDITDSVGCKHGFVADERANSVVSGVLRGHNGFHTRQGSRPCHVARENSRMRMGAAQHATVQHMWTDQIVAVIGAT